MNTRYKFLKPGDQSVEIDGKTYALNNPQLILTHAMYPLQIAGEQAAIHWQPHDCKLENAEQFRDWIQNRGGIAIWQSQDLSRAGETVTTPFLEQDGKPKPKPRWDVTDQPIRHITGLDQVQVNIDQEVKRFPIALRMGGQGLTIKLTDAASAKVRKAVEQAGKGAYYAFDYYSQEAVIFAPELTVPLDRWLTLQTLNLFVRPLQQLGGPRPALLGPYAGYAAALEAAIAFLATKTPQEMAHVFIVEQVGQLEQTVQKITRNSKPLPVPSGEKETSGGQEEKEG